MSFGAWRMAARPALWEIEGCIANIGAERSSEFKAKPRRDVGASHASLVLRQYRTAIGPGANR
jgi:hypothetical protein